MSDLFAVGLATGLATCALLAAWTEWQGHGIATGSVNGPASSAAGPGRLPRASKALALAALAALAVPASLHRIAPPPGAAESALSVVSTANRTSIGDSDVAQLEGYLGKVGLAETGRDASPRQSQMPQPAASELPDVETMIGRLAARLEHAPDDVEGWRTLGWSYLNTDRAGAAVAAYERAATIAPDRSDIAQALAEARAAAIRTTITTTPATR